MAIDPVVTSQNGLTGTERIASDKGKGGTQGASIFDLTDAAVYEKAIQTEKIAGSNNDAKPGSQNDSVTLSQLSMQAQDKYNGMLMLIENLFKMQGMKYGESRGLTYEQITEKYDGNLKSFYSNLKVDDATRLKAQQEIGEDGYWGVKQTAQRAVDFAIALSGGDTSKLAVLKEAIEKGYSEAERAWGGTLPEICRQTKEATLKGLDEWAQNN